MRLAIAVETSKHPSKRNEYKVWYLRLSRHGDVVGIGVNTKEELLQNLFANYKKSGKSNWRAFRKEAERSTPIEVFDFISLNMHENTHFGNLPTLAEFQQTVDCLQMNMELRGVA